MHCCHIWRMDFLLPSWTKKACPLVEGQLFIGQSRKTEMQCVSSNNAQVHPFQATIPFSTWGVYPFLLQKIYEGTSMSLTCPSNCSPQPPRSCLPLVLVDEWKKFLGRMQCKSEEELCETEQLEDELHLWASYRGQTFTRTGMLRSKLAMFQL